MGTKTNEIATASVQDSSDRLSVDEASELYEIHRWGKDYFSIGANGNVWVHPGKDAAKALDLKALADDLQLRGISLPILVRFGGILEHRITEIRGAFQQAIDEHNFKGRYCSVYPIKVNQQRQVVEEIFEYGRKFGFGLEAGSKPELLAVLGIADNNTPIICNGFKDDEYIEMVMLAQKIGRQIIPVVEKFSELELILKHSEQVGVRPVLGVRLKLATKGSGRWRGSAGFGAKFGLTVSEALRALETLKARGMEDCLQLLHFHIGSQITNIRQVKTAVVEGARIYVELASMGAGMRYLDVGGGLGVDYDGSQTNYESSVNYTLQEYANDIIFHVQKVCDDVKIPHPTIITECGRATSAYHSILLFNVVGMSDPDVDSLPAGLPEDSEQPLAELMETHERLSMRNLTESFHDAQQALDGALNLFSLGYLSLERRSLAERLFWNIISRIQKMAASLDEVPEELERLETLLADTYFCNFSIFQSMPDTWAIKQLFPIMPIHRLLERPQNRGILGDISCDSDGKIDRFIDRRDERRTLPLHPFTGEPYVLGAFLVGAYQEILGDLHNLFGDTNAVHITLDDDNQAVLEEVVWGDTVREVLAYVQFNADQLTLNFRKDVEKAVRERRIQVEESGRLLKFYEEGLAGYTYLEEV